MLVPFGPQSRIGIVWDRRAANGQARRSQKAQSLAGVVDAPPLPEISMRFAEWVARYTLAPLGMVVRMMMSADAAFEPPKHRFGVCRRGAPEPPQNDPGADARFGDRGRRPRPRQIGSCARAGCSTGVIDGLVAAGSLVEVAIPEKRFPRPDAAPRGDRVHCRQARAVEALRRAVDAENFR